MNDLKEACNRFFPILYADDTGLVSSLCSFLHDEDVSNTYEISRNINDELYCVQEWLNVNRLSLNVAKTKYMIFHNRQRKIDEFIPDIRINDSPIERVTDFNFLGLQIDQHLNWNAHIQTFSNKISRTLGVMNRLKRYLPTKILRVLYNSLILPHLQYAILSWGSKLSRLSKLQKKATRVIACSKFNAHTEPLFKSLKLLKLEDLLYLNVLKLYYKFLPWWSSSLHNEFVYSYCSRFYSWLWPKTIWYIENTHCPYLCCWAMRSIYASKNYKRCRPEYHRESLYAFLSRIHKLRRNDKNRLLCYAWHTHKSNAYAQDL